MNVPLPALAAAVEGLCGINVALLKALRGQVPLLYESHVVYREPSKERWHTIVDLYDLNYGDCKDLVGARVAELRYFYSERAYPYVYPTRRERHYHVTVIRGDGSAEDPSAIIQDMERGRARRRAGGQRR